MAQVEVNGKKYELHRPVIGLERKVRKLAQSIEPLTTADSEEDFLTLCVKWEELVKMIVVDPDEGLELEKLTWPEMGEVLASFFGGMTQKKPTAG